MTRNFLFEPILNILYDTMPRDNLLNSVCLELFEFVKRENVKPVIIHLVENYREKLQGIGYVDTFETLILRYDQFQGYIPEDPTLYSQGQEGTPSRSNVNGNQRWQGVKEMDAAEEAYFNTSDDEDELANKKTTPKRHPVINGISALARSLVDYPDDEEETMDAHARVMERKPIERMNAQAVDETSGASTSPSSSAPPPERMSEKRRREEADEEDELGKLSTSKRRSSSISSTSSGMSMGSNSSNVLRRKKPFMSNGKESASSSDKIKITLSAKASTGGDAKRD